MAKTVRRSFRLNISNLNQEPLFMYTSTTNRITHATHFNGLWCVGRGGGGESVPPVLSACGGGGEEVMFTVEGDVSSWMTVQ